MVTLINVEFKKLKRCKIIYISIFVLFLFSIINIFNGSRSYNGVRYFEQTGWLSEAALSLGTFYVIPVLFSLICSYIISREYQDNTMKSLLTIPINTGNLIGAKLMVSYIVSFLLSCLFFAFTTISEIAVGNKLTIYFILSNLKAFILQGTGSFIAITPIMALVVFLKKGHWISIIITSIYSFIGIFVASTSLNNIYPITAVFGFSGIYTKTEIQFAICCISLLIAMIAALVILRFSRSYKD